MNFVILFATNCPKTFNYQTQFGFTNLTFSILEPFEFRIFQPKHVKNSNHNFQLFRLPNSDMMSAVAQNYSHQNYHYQNWPPLASPPAPSSGPIHVNYIMNSNVIHNYHPQVPSDPHRPHQPLSDPLRPFQSQYTTPLYHNLPQTQSTTPSTTSGTTTTSSTMQPPTPPASTSPIKSVSEVTLVPTPPMNGNTIGSTSGKIPLLSILHISPDIELPK